MQILDALLKKRKKISSMINKHMKDINSSKNSKNKMKRNKEISEERSEKDCL